LFILLATLTISRALKRIDWGKKKQALIATQRDNQKRAEWVFKIQAWHYSQFVFIDESGVDRGDCLRRTGWSPKGIKPKRLLPGGGKDGGTRFQVLPALTVNGILGLSVYEGNTDLDGFIEYIRLEVLPHTTPFPEPNSVLIMDNASFHSHAELSGLCERYGVLLRREYPLCLQTRC
jgi:hypothetical protein